MQLTKLAEQHWIDALQRARFCAALFFCFLGLLGGILIGLTLLNLNETQGSIIYTVSVLSAVLDHAGGFSAISAWAATLFSDIVELQWLFSAAVSTLLFAIAGIASWKRIRYRMRYTTWWTIHLYRYLAVIFSFMHQVSLGGPFARGLGKALWIACFSIRCHHMVQNRRPGMEIGSRPRRRHKNYQRKLARDVRDCFGKKPRKNRHCARSVLLLEIRHPGTHVYGTPIFRIGLFHTKSASHISERIWRRIKSTCQFAPRNSRVYRRPLRGFNVRNRSAPMLRFICSPDHEKCIR